MKKITKIFFAGLLSVGFGIAAQAQSNVTTSIAASAEVMDQLTLSKITDVSFGRISANTAGDIFLNPTGTGSTFIGTTATVGKFTILGSTSASVKVNWPATVTLSTDDGGANETITYGVLVRGNGEDAAAGSAILGTGGQGVANTADVSLDATTGNYFLYVGGGFAALTGAQVRGIYTGVANFSVIYN